MPIVPLFDCAYVNKNFVGPNIIWSFENVFQRKLANECWTLKVRLWRYL